MKGYLIDRLRDKHLYLMKHKSWFETTFKCSLSDFYDDVLFGFDIFKFDEHLRKLDSDYANSQEHSMEDHILKKYGRRARNIIRKFI